MSETLTAPTCPACGAPLELMPDHTCRWCHAVVEGSADAEIRDGDALMALAKSWGEHWKLAAAPGERHAIPWSLAGQLRTPAKEIVNTLHAGLEQPGFVALAGPYGDDDVETLEWCFCLLLNNVIATGLGADNEEPAASYLQMCDLLNALASCEGTDPGWAAAAQSCAADALSRFGDGWRSQTEGDDPDPFQTNLRDWTAQQLKHPEGQQPEGKHHFWQR